ncbi:MAG: sterol desaturase family protein [Bacteroidota bacterium]
MRLLLKLPHLLRALIWPMETYAHVLSYAIPGFMLLVIIEALIARWKRADVIYGMDTISSLSSGITNVLKSVLGLSIVIVSYAWMVDKVALFEIEATWWVYVLGFVGLDLAAYWSHRFNHVINIFWNRHIIHHSSEEFNLACALRQTISDVFGVYFFLYIPLALIGIPAQVLAVLAPLHLFAQFWYHTRLIDRMGILEHILVTPSHHRVHHAINKEYLDKNYAAIFIVWDKWFGTFQEELPDVPAIYGTKRPAGTWNPILINFMHVWTLMQDAWRTRNWWDKIRLWFMPTGWRPADVAEKYPVFSVDDAFDQQKYRPATSSIVRSWSWAQLVIHTLLLYHLLTLFGDYSLFEIGLYAAFIFLGIFSYTTLMDGHKWALPFEGLKLALGIGVLAYFGSWFNLDQSLPLGTVWVVSYMLISMGITMRVVMRLPKEVRA